MIRGAALAGSAMIALAGTGLQAQGNDPQASDAEAAGIQDIIVTAERRATSLQNTPLSIIAVTTETVQAKGIEDLQDLSTFTPNLTISASRGNGNNQANFGIRGIAGGGGATGERGVGLYIDGIYVPRTSGAVLRVLDIDRIEVLRGPQGTLFGRNSTGGAIRIFSKQPTNQTEGYIRATAGSQNRVDLVGMINLPISETFAVRLQGAYLDQDGYVQRGTEKLGAQKDIIGRIVAKWTPAPNLTATLGFLYGDSKANGTPLVFKEFDMRPGVEGVIQGNYADWINDAFKLAGQAPLQAYNDPRIVRGAYKATDICLIDDFNPDYDPACNQINNNEYWQADLNVKYDLSESVSLSSVTGYAKLDHRGISDYQVLGTEVRRDDLKSKVFYQELQLNAALFNNAIDFVTGVNYFYEDSGRLPNFTLTRRGSSVFPSAAQQAAAGFDINNFGNGNRDAGLFRTADTVITQISKSWGIFGSATWHVTDRLNVTGGLRQAWDKKKYAQTRFPGTPGITAVGNTPIFSTSPEFSVAPGTTSTTVNAGDTFRALDYRATVDYHLTDDIMAYATISKAYKAGTFSYTIASWTAANNATGAAQSAAIRAIPNEKVVNYEVGARMTLFNGRLRINPTYFEMDYTSRQAAVQVQCASIGIPASQCPVGFVIQVQNQGDVKLRGVEVDGQLLVVDGFVIDASAGITTPRLKNAPAGTVNLFPDVASPTFNVGGTWTIRDTPGKAVINFNYAYVGEQDTHPSDGTDSSYTLPAYGLVNARIQFIPVAAPITVSVFANNLLNKTYGSYAQRFGGGFWDAGGPPNRLSAPNRSALAEVRGRPREIGVTLQFNF
jgi:iron complex outermembrane receptor protein